MRARRHLVALEPRAIQELADREPRVALAREDAGRVEQQVATEFLASASDRSDAYRSLIWALLATNEFLFNH